MRAMLDPVVESAMRERIGTAPFSTWMGIKLVELQDGASEVRMIVEPHHRNPGGIAHGGIIATMLDVAIGLALRTKLGMSASHVTVNLAINYLRPASGDTLVARGRTVRSGGRIAYGEASLFDGDDVELARATATFLTLADDGRRPALDGE